MGDRIATLPGYRPKVPEIFQVAEKDVVLQVRDDTIDILNDVATTLKGVGIDVANFGIGSTPSCSHPGEKMRQLTEIHPGNYVFYDLQQEMVGGDQAGVCIIKLNGS